jgi:hypothetical protein
VIVAEALRALWGPRLRRSEEPIVGTVRYDGKMGTWENDHWAFSVPYVFRDALDIRFDARKKNRQTVMVWTQGACISFAEGDVLTSKDERVILRVTYAVPMGWDGATESMYEGAVAFDVFEHAVEGLRRLYSLSGTQMEFLNLLVTGSFKERRLQSQ